MKIKKRNKKTYASQLYDKKYYSEFCRTPDDFLKEGVFSGYEFVPNMLAPKKDDRILDIGCGRGEIVKICNNNGAHAIGMDYSQEAVQIASQGGNKYVIRAEATRLPFASESFDKVLLMEVIEHLDSDDGGACLQEIWRVLKRGGYLVLTTPNSWNIIMLFGVRLLNMVGIRIKWMSREDPYHINVLNPIKLWRLLKQHNFRIKLFPKIKYSNKVSLSERIKNSLLFFAKHLRCIAYK